MRRVRQTVQPPRLDDVRGATQAAMRSLLADTNGGAEVAVGVGSRGIASLAAITRTVLDELTAAGFEPFVVPAMGSHGGGTAEGQLEVLEGYGITEQTMGVPLRATMETVAIGTVDGFEVVIDRNVVEAGRAFVINRVKPHTDFQGSIGSGLAKMAAVGLGKQRGAQKMHLLGPDGLRDVMPAVGRFVAERLLLGGLAIVENQLDETMLVEALPPAGIGGRRESELLELARAELPRIPFGDLDVVIVEQIGKDISGTGVDPNVLGRWLVLGLPEPQPVLTRSVVALDLTPASHGNALGIGLVDFVPERLAAAIDHRAMYVNGLTSGWLGFSRSKLPIVLPTDSDAIATAAAVCARVPGDPRLVWIRDTLSTRELAISRALWDEAGAQPGLEPVGEPFTPAFVEGRLVRLDEA
ncbi:MAG: hypothetical protein U0R50_16240 [Gaiellales bacterium]